MGLLEQGLFLHEHGLDSAIGGRASEATVLLAGMSGEIASTVAKELTFKGVVWDRMLFCDYF
jgi:predicted amino acid dehydrogenase